jgi:hypothetical protein
MAYRKRFRRRARVDRPGMDFTDRDAELLRIAYDYEPATTVIINALAPRQSMAPGLRAYFERTRPPLATSPAAPGISRALYRRLDLLFDHAYLDRRKLNSANDPTLHLVCSRGAAELVERFGYARRRINWHARNRAIGTSHLNHSLMISSFHCALELAARLVDDTSIAFWLPDGSIKEYVSYEESAHDSTYINESCVLPDATTALQRVGTRSHFFVEADRTTTTRKVYLAKLKAYVHFARQGLHRTRLGIAGYDVLTITKSPERRDNLCALAEEAFNRPRDYKRFLFATEKDTWRDPLGKIRAEALLEPIWYRPHENEPRALLTR